MDAGWYAGRDGWHNPIEIAHWYTSEGFGDGGVIRRCDGRGSVVRDALTAEPVMVNGEPARKCLKCERKMKRAMEIATEYRHLYT